MSLSEHLVPIRNAARAYGKRRSEVAMVALARAIVHAVDGVGIDYATEEFTRAQWLSDLLDIAVTEAAEQCREEAREELERRLL